MSIIEEKASLRQAIIDAIFKYEDFMDEYFTKSLNSEENNKEKLLRLKVILNNHRHLEDDIEDIMGLYQDERLKKYQKFSKETGE